MLPKKYRLADRQMFRKALSNRVKTNGIFFMLASLVGEVSEEPKIGTIISGKISKKAVVRNRIRRILYDSARKFLGKIGKGSVLVFLAKKTVIQATNEEISSDIDNIITKLTK